MSDDLPQHVAALCQATEAEPFLTAFQAATRSAAISRSSR